MRGLWWCVLPLCVGCGVADGKLLSELSAEQAMSVCDEYAPRTIPCGDEVEREVCVFGGTCEDAMAPSSCMATVGDYRACQEAVEALSDAAFCDEAGAPIACDAVLDASCLVSE